MGSGAGLLGGSLCSKLALVSKPGSLIEPTHLECYMPVCIRSAQRNSDISHAPEELGILLLTLTIVFLPESWQLTVRSQPEQ